MVEFSRRDLIGAGAALALAFGTGGAAGLFAAPAAAQGFGQTGPLRTRRDLRTLTLNDDDLTALRYAIPRMKADDGPLGWNRQIAIHADMRWGHHRSWRFLPWHRLQLLHLERIIATISGHDSFAMPYWNWADDHIPPVCFNRSTPFYHSARDAGPQSLISDYVGLDVKVGVRDAEFLGRPGDDFNYFFGEPNHGDPVENYMGSAEQYGHNLVHLFVGGDMINLNTSPADPLFFFHHSNVDRVWAEWTRIWGDQTFAAAWGAELLSGYVDETGQPTAPRAAREVTSTTALGYRYDALPPTSSVKLQDELWPGFAPAAPPHQTHRRLEMERLSFTSGRVFVPPDMTQNLLGAKGLTLDVAGFLQVAGDGYVVRLASRSYDQSWTFKDDAVFSVPMGGMLGSEGHKVQLQSLIPRNEQALGEGVWIQADARPLGKTDQTVGLQSFIVEFDAQLPFRT